MAAVQTVGKPIYMARKDLGNLGFLSEIRKLGHSLSLSKKCHCHFFEQSEDKSLHSEIVHCALYNTANLNHVHSSSPPHAAVYSYLARLYKLLVK